MFAAEPIYGMTVTEIEKTDLQAIDKIVEGRARIKKEIAKVIVGQEEVIDDLLIALFCKGHCLFVGVPGLAKTLLVSTLANVLNLRFNRIQFTPDLMPADITGTDILEQDHASGKRFFKFIKGPIFSNILLADEINRTPPKTQAALLQAMQEYKVTASGTTYSLDLPFVVFATQNPIEQEGTYPLPEAQLDRFMFQINVQYPSKAEEIEIVRTTTSTYKPTIDKAFSPEEITSLQDLVTRVPVADYVLEYAIRLVRASRPSDSSSPDFIKKWISWGLGLVLRNISSWEARHAPYWTAGMQLPVMTSGQLPNLSCNTALLLISMPKPKEKPLYTSSASYSTL